jgi:enoyl-CoA hydratase/carnithine racemase
MNRETVIAEHGDGVALITMNRPSKRNAFNDQQYDDLRDALSMLATTTRSRQSCLLPGAFSGGRDLGRWPTGAYDDGQPHGFTRSSTA